MMTSEPHLPLEIVAKIVPRNQSEQISHAVDAAAQAHDRVRVAEHRKQNEFDPFSVVLKALRTNDAALLEEYLLPYPSYYDGAYYTMRKTAQIHTRDEKCLEILAKRNYAFAEKMLIVMRNPLDIHNLKRNELLFWPIHYYIVEKVDLDIAYKISRWNRANNVAAELVSWWHGYKKACRFISSCKVMTPELQLALHECGGLRVMTGNARQCWNNLLRRGQYPGPIATPAAEKWWRDKFPLPERDFWQQSPSGDFTGIIINEKSDCYDLVPANYRTLSTALHCHNLEYLRVRRDSYVSLVAGSDWDLLLDETTNNFSLISCAKILMLFNLTPDVLERRCISEGSLPSTVDYYLPRLRKVYEELMAAQG